MTFLFVLVATLALSWLLTAAVRAVARSAKLIDVPNERSSHSVPTPRGGGVAIVLSFLFGLFLLDLLGPQRPAVFGGLVVAAVLVAAVGLIDDRWQLRASTRMLGHLAAAMWVLWHLGSMPPLPVLGVSIDLGWLGPPLATVYIAWAINFFNFMDGIDGIAALETIAVSVGGALLNYVVIGGTSWLLPMLLALSAAGFLVWNWPPARIFMGDAGSGFLGLMVGAMTLGYGYQAPVLYWCWLILQGCFMVDATTTLLRRVMRGESPGQPHRTHAYQFAARLRGGHRPVTVAYAALTLLWLLPIATTVALDRLDGALACVIAYLPLVVLAFRYHAGAREMQDL